ncbi:hypothetical protein F5B22DRAFT_624838, partial [Xylaria bambusicola]|uniref:uncharacterized protein n=1 Tax=Xylaria bambusicola TaxID=326684 RepID=UPI0020088EE5
MKISLEIHLVLRSPDLFPVTQHTIEKRNLKCGGVAMTKMNSWKLIALLLMQGNAEASSPRYPVAPKHLKLGLLPRAFNTTGTFVVPTSFSTPPIESSSSSVTGTSVSLTSSVSITSSNSSTPSVSSTFISSDTTSGSTNHQSSQPSTSQSSSEEFSITPVTSFPAYTAPTSTISGASETSSAAAIAPLFIAVWQNRGNLLDSQEKSQYINDVTETKNQVDSLNNNLSDKSDPPSECSSTSGDGSLIAGIKNLLTTPAKLIGCAAAVASNLVDAISKPDPVISVVEVLTDTLMDIGSELEKSQDEHPTSSRDQITSTSQSSMSTETTSSSECSTTTAASCVETVSLSTLFYTDSTTTTSQVETITTTLCTTITASCVVGTTATTTVSTATTSSGTGWICDQTCAAGGCQAHKRAAQATGIADPGADAPNLANRNLKPTSMISDIDKYIIQTISASNSENLDWSKGIAVAKYYKFLKKGIAGYVAGVTGCTSIVIASQKGAWISHFTETGLMDDAGRQKQRDSLADAVANGNDYYKRPSDLAGEGGDLNKDTQDVQIYVSAPCTTVTDESGNRACTGDSSFEYPRIDALLDTLFGAGTPFEGVPITRRGYLKPAGRDEVDALADTSARGKVVVQYDPNQLTPEFLPFNPKHAAYRVWMESTPYQKDWVASTCQGGNAPNQKRDDSCPISGSGSPTPTPTTADTSGIPTTSDIATSMNTSTPIISSTAVLTSSPSLTPSVSFVNTTMVTMTLSPSSNASSTSLSTSGVETSDSGIGPTFMSTVTFSSLTATLIA